jgi:hypothetical protein
MNKTNFPRRLFGILEINPYFYGLKFRKQ